MRKLYLLLLPFLTISCQVTETIRLNADGSGTIEVVGLRDENSYMQITGENYSKEEIYKDTTYVFGDYIKKHQETFSRTPVADQNLFLRYSQVKVHQKSNSYEKEFSTTYSQNFKKVADIVDLSKADHYLDDVKNNYALSAEEHYYKVSYNYSGDHFSRIVTITDPVALKKEFAEIEQWKAKLKGYKVVQKYSMNYHFPRKIQSVSNPLAKISADKKSVVLEMTIFDCLQNPESTNLEVILESNSVD